jgi:hypothetical protein
VLFDVDIKVQYDGGETRLEPQ